MKITGLSGSPRKNGNTEILIEEILNAAKEKGAQTKLYHLNTMSIKGCQGCYSCKDNGICVIKDDMQPLYKEIYDSDYLVIGTPIYMFQMTAQLKLFIDRTLPFLKPDFTSRFPKKKNLILVYTQGNPDVKSFEPYLNYIKTLYEFGNFDIKETLIAAGTMAKDDVLKQKDLMEKARNIGVNVVKEGSLA